MSKNFIPLHNTVDDKSWTSKHPHFSPKLSRLQLHTRHVGSGLNRFKGRITSAAVVIALLAGGPFAYKGYMHSRMETQTKADAVRQINDANKPYLESPVYNRHRNIFYDRLSSQGHRLIEDSHQEMLHNYALAKEAKMNETKQSSAGYPENTSIKTFQTVQDNIKHQTQALKKKNPSIKVRIKGMSTQPNNFLPSHVSKIDWQIANLETKNVAQKSKYLTGKTVSNATTHTVYAFIKPDVAKQLNINKYAKQHHVMGKVLKVNTDTTYNKINHTTLPTLVLHDSENIMKQSDTQGINIVLVSQTPQTKVQKAKAKIKNLIAKLKTRFHRHKVSTKDVNKYEQSQRNKDTSPLKPNAVHKHTAKRHARKAVKNRHKTYNAFKSHHLRIAKVHRRTSATPPTYLPNNRLTVHAPKRETETAQMPTFLPKTSTQTHTLHINPQHTTYNAIKGLRI